MMRDSFPVPIDAFLTIVSATVRAIIHGPGKNDYNFYSLLFLITLASRVYSLLLKNNSLYVDFSFSPRGE
jgi:hypothetical protein